MSAAPEWTYWLTAFGAIISPIVAYIVAGRNVDAVIKVARQQVRAAEETARRQVQASVVSSNRQKWIDGLREDIAEFLTEGTVIRSHLSSPSRGDLTERARPLLLVFNRIKLRLNPKEDDHIQLVNMLDAFIVNPADAEGDFGSKITDAAQRILKREWTRVKTGD